jgi:hypothetical protein
LLLFLTLIALILDIIIFTHGDFIKDILNMVDTNLFSINKQIEDNKNIKDNTQDTYKDINDIILEQLIHYNKLHDNSNNIKSYNSVL